MFQAQILPLLRRARQLNPNLTIMATPWSPPAWMKTTDSLVGGRLKDDPRIVDAYARYLVRFVTAYTAAGVPVDYLSVQNEPQNRTPDGYPGTDLPVVAQAKVITALGPLLRKASPGTKILAYDHNWATHPNDIASTPPGEDPATDYPYQILSGPAARWVAGTGATGDGTRVHLWSYVGGTNQQWLPVSLDGGQWRFVARHSGKCLDVRDVSTADGAQMQQWSCTGGVAQSFRLIAQP